MDKNTIIGFVLIGLVLFTFSWLNRPSAEQLAAQQHYRDSVARAAAQAEANQTAAQTASFVADSLADATLPDSVRNLRMAQQYGPFAAAIAGEEQFITLQNNRIALRISTRGGRIYSAELKEYQTYNKQPLVLFDAGEASFGFTLVTAANRVVNTSDLYFTPVEQRGDSAVTLRLQVADGSYIDYAYSLAPDSYMVGFNIRPVGMNGILSPAARTLDLTWTQQARQLEKGRKDEDESTALYYKYAADDVESLSESKNDEEQIANRLKWIGFKNKFFATVLIADNAFTASRLTSTVIESGDRLKNFSAITSIDFDLTKSDPIGFRFYIGPTKYNLLRSFDKGTTADERLTLDELVPLGMLRPINKYFILPIFDFLGNFFSNYGLIIFLLTLVVKLCLFPLTYKSYMSTAKMRVLRPQVEEINARYPKQEQAMERQRATMELYSRAGASPLSGCLPMLLQMPILIALYWLFPTAIELRQESFLWANDLSTYDAIFSWDFYIPLLSDFMGNHISLFCLLMTLVNIVYTKFNMDATNTGQQQMPGMKMMMYIMPLMMFFLFNQKSAGLSYYFLISTMITILQTLSFRYFVNEEKLLLRLEENKKKPRKKSSFMQRLEEAQRQQQEQLKKQQNQRAQQQAQHRQKRQ